MAGVLYAVRYAFFLTTVALGVLPVSIYFSTASFFPPPLAIPVFLLANIPVQVFYLIPTLVYLIPSCFFAIGLHNLKKKTRLTDLDGVIFSVFATLIIGQCGFALACIIFGHSLERIAAKGLANLWPRCVLSSILGHLGRWGLRSKAWIASTWIIEGSSSDMFSSRFFAKLQIPWSYPLISILGDRHGLPVKSPENSSNC